MSSELIKNITDASFQVDVLGSELPVLVNFWSSWSTPCRITAPIVDEIAEAYKGKLTVVKLNIDENPDTTAELGVRCIPSVKLFKNGKNVATKDGAMSKLQLETFIKESLQHN